MIRSSDRKSDVFNWPRAAQGSDNIVVNYNDNGVARSISYGNINNTVYIYSLVILAGLRDAFAASANPPGTLVITSDLKVRIILGFGVTITGFSGSGAVIQELGLNVFTQNAVFATGDNPIRGIWVTRGLGALGGIAVDRTPSLRAVTSESHNDPVTRSVAHWYTRLDRSFSYLYVYAADIFRECSNDADYCIAAGYSGVITGRRVLEDMYYALVANNLPVLVWPDVGQLDDVDDLVNMDGPYFASSTNIAINNWIRLRNTEGETYDVNFTLTKAEGSYGT